MLDGIPEAQIKQFLCGTTENTGTLSRDVLKDFLANVIGRFTRDSANHTCQINYHIGIDLEIKVVPQGRTTLSPGLVQAHEY